MYYSDKPIESKKEDLLNRKSFASLLAKAILNLNTIDTFTVGLFGCWGSGKTSLINMMLKEIEKYDSEEEIVVVHFEPWNFSNTNQLLEQFLIRLSNVLRSSEDKKLAKVGVALCEYSEAFEMTEIIPKVGKAVASGGKKGSQFVGKKLQKGYGEKDVLKQKEMVISSLIKQEKRILIVIDDIDRLNNVQIRQMFQVITSVARFPYITYLVAFDKEIVIKALEQVQEGNGEEYLEKIIQMPIQIPNIQRNELRQVLFNRLDRIIADNKIILQQEHWQRLFEPCINPFITNIREVNRLCNLVQFKLSALGGEIDFVDLVVISVIEIICPSLYEWIKINKECLTGEYDWSLIRERDKSQKEWYEAYKNQVSTILPANKNEMLQKEYVDKLLFSMACLFPHFGQKIGKTREVNDLKQFRKHNQIAHPEKFDRYFNLNMDYIAIKKSEIAQAIYLMNDNELNRFFIEINRKNLSYEFLEEINAVVSEISPERTKELIQFLVENGSEFDSGFQKGITSIPTSLYAEYLILELFKNIPKDDRANYLTNLINNGNLRSMNTIARVINMVELAYGRMAANGEERDYDKIITLSELVELEINFVSKVKTILENNSLFDFSDYRITLYLLENIIPNEIDALLEKEFQSEENILKYLLHVVSVWTGSTISYEVKAEYRKYLSEERIMKAMETLIEHKEFFKLSDKVQNVSAAFYLMQNKIIMHDGHIAQEDVNILLKEWGK